MIYLSPWKSDKFCDIKANLKQNKAVLYKEQLGYGRICSIMFNKKFGNYYIHINSKNIFSTFGSYIMLQQAIDAAEFALFSRNTETISQKRFDKLKTLI